MEASVITKPRIFGVLFSLTLLLSMLYTFAYLKRPVWRVENYSGNISRQILSWNNFFSDHQFMVPSLEELNCPISSCQVTANRNTIESADAILLHWRNIDYNDMPKKRPGQRIFLLNYESPLHTRIPELPKLTGLVDWTISYRLDSDILALYGKIVERTTKDVQNYVRYTKGFGEKRLAAWMVSNCNVPSKRRNVVNQLQHLGVTIDEYGACSTGNHSLPASRRSEGYEFLSKRYKFYMSFENSLCKDYATEKMFQPLYHGMIPIVYGGANYKELLPRNSFIDVLDYPSLEDLAKHLKHIENNESALLSYHEWRQNFEIVNYEISNDFFCDLCANLHNLEVVPKVGGRNLTTWWTTKDCLSPILSHKMINISAMADKRRDLYT